MISFLVMQHQQAALALACSNNTFCWMAYCMCFKEGLHRVWSFQFTRPTLHGFGLADVPLFTMGQAANKLFGSTSHETHIEHSAQASLYSKRWCTLGSIYGHVAVQIWISRPLLSGWRPSLIETKQKNRKKGWCTLGPISGTWIALFRAV